MTSPYYNYVKHIHLHWLLYFKREISRKTSLQRGHEQGSKILPKVNGNQDPFFAWCDSNQSMVIGELELLPSSKAATKEGILPSRICTLNLRLLPLSMSSKMQASPTFRWLSTAKFRHRLSNLLCLQSPR